MFPRLLDSWSLHGCGVRATPCPHPLNVHSAPITSKAWSRCLLLIDVTYFSNNLQSESESRSVVSDSLQPHGLYSPGNSPGQNTGVGSLSLLQGIFPAQGSNRGLPHCRWILYQMSHKGSPRILEWAAYPFSNGSP